MVGRATVSLLFCDLVGSTALMNRMGNEASDELRRDLFAALRRPVDVHGGDEIKSQGDGLMVAFHEPADAVACALAMQAAVGSFDRHRPGLGVSVRVGVSSGGATAEDGDWFGTPVVEAARLCGAAAPGQVLVAAETHTRTAAEDDLDFTSAGALSLKGFPEDRPAWAVTWKSPPVVSPPLPPGLDPTGEAPVRGRAQSMSTLTDAVWTDASTRARLVAVVGEAGVGKTRLAAEFAADFARRGGRVAYARVTASVRGLDAVCDGLRWTSAYRQTCQES